MEPPVCIKTEEEEEDEEDRYACHNVSWRRSLSFPARTLTTMAVELHKPASIKTTEYAGKSAREAFQAQLGL